MREGYEEGLPDWTARQGWLAWQGCQAGWLAGRAGCLAWLTGLAGLAGLAWLAGLAGLAGWTARKFTHGATDGFTHLKSLDGRLHYYLCGSA